MATRVSTCSSAIVALMLCCLSAAQGELKAGDVLSPDNWQEAEGLLPAEFLDLYRRGDFHHRVAEWRFDPIDEDPVFKAALEANAGRYDLSDAGSIIDTRAGQAPDYVYGWPFPRIDPSDPKAAMKIVWNYFDKELFMGSYSSKYDWQGRLMASFAGIRTNIIKVGPGEFWGWDGGAVSVAINWKLDRATTAGIVVGEGVPADSRIPLSPHLFSLQNLMAKGK